IAGGENGRRLDRAGEGAAAGCDLLNPWQLARNAIMDFVKMLGSVLEQGVTPSTGRRLDNAVNRPGGLDVGELLGALRGGDVAGQIGELLGNLGNMGQSALRSGPEGATNPMVTGGLGALAGALLGGGSGSVKGAMGGTALAVLGGLAMKALAARQGATPDRGQTVPGFGPGRTKAAVDEMQHTAELTIRAMLNAAKADGHGDREEIRRIIGEASEDGLTQEEKDFIDAEIHKPMETAAIVRAVPNQQVRSEERRVGKEGRCRGMS